MCFVSWWLVGRVPAVASSFPELKMVDFRGNQLEGPSPWLVKDFLALDDLPVMDGETKQFEEDVVEDTAND